MTDDMINNSVIIGCERVDLTPYLGNLDEENYVISWKSFGYLAKKFNRESDNEETHKAFFSILPKGKKYAVRFPENRLYTNKEGMEFVETMLNRSNFAKANKIVCILYRQENKPCGVLTEEF